MIYPFGQARAFRKFSREPRRIGRLPHSPMGKGRRPTQIPLHVSGVLSFPPAPESDNVERDEADCGSRKPTVGLTTLQTQESPRPRSRAPVGDARWLVLADDEAMVAQHPHSITPWPSMAKFVSVLGDARNGFLLFYHSARARHRCDRDSTPLGAHQVAVSISGFRFLYPMRPRGRRVPSVSSAFPIHELCAVERAGGKRAASLWVLRCTGAVLIMGGACRPRSHHPWASAGPSFEVTRCLRS
jgi:hypothetical protein